MDYTISFLTPMNQLIENPILYIDYIISFLTPKKETEQTNYDERKSNETTHYNLIYNENKNN